LEPLNEIRAPFAVTADARTPRTTALRVDDSHINRIVVSHFANARVSFRPPGEQQPRTALPMSRRRTRARVQKEYDATLLQTASPSRTDKAARRV
jgi:hypothetical protein